MSHHCSRTNSRRWASQCGTRSSLAAGSGIAPQPLRWNARVLLGWMTSDVSPGPTSARFGAAFERGRGAGISNAVDADTATASGRLDVVCGTNLDGRAWTRADFQTETIMAKREEESRWSAWQYLVACAFHVVRRRVSFSRREAADATAGLNVARRNSALLAALRTRPPAEWDEIVRHHSAAEYNDAGPPSSVQSDCPPAPLQPVQRENGG